MNPIQTPGVYINELNAFPNSMPAIPTAVPAFIGYTPQAEFNGRSYTNVPLKITSFLEFKTVFGFPDPPAPANPAKQYAPEYYLVEQKNQPQKGEYLLIGNVFYSVVPDPSTVYYLYNSVQLFYQNGGGEAYIVSVGTYGEPTGNPMNPGDQLVNPNVKLNDLLNGLSLLKDHSDPTMYSCPEATLLSIADNAILMQAMLAQCEQLGSAISLLDVIGGKEPDPVLWTTDISNFRNNTGSNGLDYGAAYYPFVGTTIMQGSDIDYTNLFGGNIDLLADIINPASNPDPTVTQIVATIKNPASGSTVSQNNAALLNASPSYSQIIKAVLSDANMLPPGGGMAGVITTTDNAVGPWEAPANKSMVGVVSLPILLTEAQQANLNVDAVSGKSINAIRFFNGLGILVWGARTLDGNSSDWRYINVRRTMIYIEQSCKAVTQACVFEPNNANTWFSVKSTISNFLTSLWKQGGLVGTSPVEAFQVMVGLGTTMNATDILNGYMKVSVKVALVHPAEYMVITFQQQMAGSSDWEGGPP